MAHNTNYGAYTTMTIPQITQNIPFDRIEGLTISGGEPFLQATSLYHLIVHLRKQKDIGVIIYSGYTLQELKKYKKNLPLLAETDILIDGQYIKEMDDGRAYIGSSNQTIHYLSDRYKDVGQVYYAQSVGDDGNRPALSNIRKCEIKLFNNQAILIGVPSAQTLKVWQDMKRKMGGEIYDI